ncbi:MAG TPA: IS1595 family transposase [Candidatus Solibacter sp.]|jgi:transposase|nr:IS1595 family transposase [Candidatus Solibacter sp.]
MAPGNRNAPFRSTASESQYSLFEFMAEFPDDAACLNWLWRTRHAPDGDHAMCPKCEVERRFVRYGTAQQRQSWTCTACGHHLHPTAGTIFNKSSTSLHLWFYAIYLMTSTRCGISAKQLERELGVTYKTAWRMFKLIRTLMAEDTGPLSGAVEMDETFINRSRRHRPNEPRLKQGKSGPGERVIWGAVERGGRVVAKHVPRASKASIDPMVTQFVMPASTVFTDEAIHYKGLGNRGYQHERIQHTARIYVKGDVHTQTIEGFWSLFKRGVTGVYHAVGKDYLQSYLNEYTWRYNHRFDGRSMFATLVRKAAS